MPALEAAIDANAHMARLFVTSLATGGAANDTLIITSRVDGNFTDISITGTDAAGGDLTVSAVAAVSGTASTDVDVINLGDGADWVEAGGGADTIDLGAADATQISFTLANADGDGKTIVFEAGTGTDVVNFVSTEFSNGTGATTLASVASNGAVGANDIF